MNIEDLLKKFDIITITKTSSAHQVRLETLTPTHIVGNGTSDVGLGDATLKALTEFTHNFEVITRHRANSANE